MIDQLISVIVPVYKVEPYLDRCVLSIVNQTYTNLEIILVDDGSPDNCPAMCDAWAEKDGRIRVVHQENTGGGQARNRALDISRGEFVAFVDSDDYISPDMISYLHEQFQTETDIVECDYCIVNDDNALFDSRNELSEKRAYGTIDAMREHIRDHCFRQIIWNKMYRRRVIGDVRFPIGTKIDDEFWTFRVLGNAACLVAVDKKMYAYRQQNNSVMHLLSEKERLQAIEAKLQRHEYIRSYFPSLEGESLINLWFTCLYQGQLVLRSKDSAENRKIWKRIIDAIYAYPLGPFISEASGMHKLWLRMASVSFSLTCRCRNAMKIGL